MNTNLNSKTLLIKYAKNYSSSIVLLTIIYIASTALFILVPQALSHFIDSVYNNNTGFSIAIAIMIYLAVSLAKTALTAVLNIQLSSVGQRITDDYRSDVMAKYLSLDMQNLNNWTSGIAVTRLDEDVQGLFNYYYILIYKLAGSGLALCGVLAVLVFRSGWLCAALLLVSILSIIGFKIIQDRGIAKYVRRSAAAASFNGTMKELLENAVTLRALHAENFAETRMKAAMKSYFKESFPASLMYGNLWSASTIMEGIIITLGLFFAMSLWDSGTISVGMVYLIYSYSEMIIDPLVDFRTHMGNMQSAKSGILRTQELLETPSSHQNGTKQLTNQPPSLTIKDLSFAYKDGAQVLKNINLSIPSCGRLGIMGKTGCGKSTLIGLIAGLNPYDNGSICLNGIELKEIDEKSLRENVAYCTQKVQLIHGTLRDNISLYDEHYSKEDILKAIHLLGLSEWFEKFPMGLDTYIEMADNNLSSGEAQLITLIRLALRHPRMVLLDEITSSLDAITERRITRAVEALCKNSTVIAIAHNEAPLDWMDSIIYMEDGALKTASTGGDTL